LILSDGSIRKAIVSGRLGVEPFDPQRVQPASVDVTLGDEFRYFPNARHIDPVLGLGVGMVRWSVGAFDLCPGQFALGCTAETLTIPDDMVARIEGKSSLGRVGLIVHSTAGFIDPGFSGQVTLELYNLAGVPIVLRPGMAIAQISFHLLDKPALVPYGSPGLGSKYQGQTGAVASRYGHEVH
jgi:dCTP deaminase